MIFTDRTITVRKGESRIDEPIVVYRGDYELEVRFTILNSKFRFISGTNLIESEKASYGQLAILTPYGGNIFSDIVRCNDGRVTFVLTAEMLNQIEEVGLYSFQIRLMDYIKESRVSIPPIEFGIEVREPIASEDHDNSVNNAIVGYSIAKVVDPKEEKVGDTFDGSGNYNKTKWETGDRISEGKLNKIEDAIDKVNRNEKSNTATLSKRIDNNFNVLDATKADKNEIFTMANMGQDIKEAMTGGSVAIIGKDTVLTENIVDKQVTADKTDFVNDLSQKQILDYNALDIGYYYTGNASNPDTKAQSGNPDFCTVKMKLKEGERYVVFGVDRNFTFYVNDGVTVKLEAFPNHSVYVNYLSGKSNDIVRTFSCPTSDYIYFTFRCNMDNISKPMIFKSDENIYLEDYKPYGYALNDFIEIPKLKGINAEATTFCRPIYQYVDPLKVTHGKYYARNTTTAVDSVTECVMAPLRIKKGEEYFYKNIYGYFSCIKYDNGNIIPLSDSTASYLSGSFVAVMDGYAYFTINNRNGYLGSEVSVSNSKNGLIGDAVGFLWNEIKDIFIPQDECVVKVNTITVKPSGGDFSNPMTATKSIKNANEKNIYNIYIHEGDYDIASVFTDEDFSGTAADAGWRLPDYVNLIGIGDVDKIICRCELPDDYSTDLVLRISCLNVDRNNNIENITFIAKNTRYTVHDESSNTHKNWTKIIKNCKFIHLGNASHFQQWHGAWCEGSSSGSHSYFENCEFFGVRQGYGFHNNKKFTEPSVHVFENCKFTNSTTAYPCIFESLGSGVKDKVIMKNCEIKGSIQLKETVAGSGIDIHLEGSGNTLVPVIIDTTTSNQYVFNFYDQVKVIKNCSNEIMKKYTPVMIDVYGNAYPCSYVNVCNGIVMKDIGVGENGYIQYRGYIDNTLSAPILSKIGIVDSQLAVVTDDYLGVVDGSGLIKLKAL